MKRIFKVIFLGALIFVLTSFSADAESSVQGEYIVSEANGEYLLSGYSEGGVSPIIRSKTMREITEYLNEQDESIAVVFNEIYVDEDISFNCHDIRISGTVVFSEYYSLEISEGKITAETLKLNFDKGSLIIKDGDFVFKNSEILSNKTAVKMNYSAGARARFESGKIVCDSEEAGILIDIGQASFSDCSVYNASGVAIINSSTLTLLPEADIKGCLYDISTKTPITLVSDDNAFYHNIKIKYDKIFEKGTLSCVFYSASQSALENVSLFDINGLEQPLTFFESYEGEREINFGAVYLPYTVDFYFESTLVTTQKIIGDERVREEEGPQKIGYDFVGWTKSGSEESYDFAKKVKSDFSLHAGYRLTSPKVTLSSLEFTYDGKEHEFGITEISHPLADSAIINYEWYYNGKFVSDSGPKIKLLNVSQSGKYYCTVSFTYGTDTAKTTAPSVSVTIKKAVVPIPSVSEKEYNGEHQSSGILETSYYTVSDAGGVFVGVYPVVLMLKDSANCRFANGENVVTLNFRIAKAQNFWTEELRVFDIYEGMTPSHSAISRFGEIKYIYSDKIDGDYSASPPSTHGVYYCMAYVEDSENYSRLYSEPVKFTVVEEIISGISILKMPDKCEYTAFESFCSDGLYISVTHNSARVEVVGAEKLIFSYQSSENFRYGDKGVIATYLGASITVPVTVRQAQYDTSTIVFEDSNLTYNGTQMTLSCLGVLPVGEDGIPLTATVVGGGTNAGVYTVALVFSSDSKNYEIPEPIERTLTVLPYKSRVVFSDLAFVYDGKEKCPSAYYLDIYGRKVEVEVDGGRSLAGDYIAVACASDSNYLLDGTSVKFSILKADYDFSSVRWNGGGYVYDGEEKRVYLEGLPAGVRVVGYSDNVATSAGVYTAKASYSYDERNYNLPPELPFEWKIEKAEYDASVFEFSDAEYVYDGIAHYPAFAGDMPVGIDGISLEYEFSAGVTHVGEGAVRVEILFSTESPNYKAPDKAVATVKILPKGIFAEWENLRFVYDLSIHVPSAYSAECSVSVLGAMTDAGTYTATAVPLVSDYFVINSTVEYTIEKAENFWTHKIEIDDIYEGREPTPHAECITGEVVYVYYSHSGEVLSEIPKESGIYYVKAFSEGSRNYKALSSELLEFRIIKVVPISITVALLKTEYKAFEVIANGDINVTVSNNDGSTLTAPFEQITLSYENADSLRYLDSVVSVSCYGFSERVGITVVKADYDMSGVHWSEKEFVYDGTRKSVMLLGLPSGLSVAEYKGASGIDAGIYTAEALFDYDSKNYNPPSFECLVWRVKKQNVPFPTINSMEYNGREQKPLLTDSDLYTVSFSGAKDSGTYPITLVLRDPNNYKFGDFGDRAVIYYEISPRVITVRLGDIDKYLFSDMPQPEYVLVNGTLVEGEEIELLFSYSENEVYCTSENPNYSVRVIPGNIIRHASLSEKGLLFIFVAFVLLVLLALATVFIIYKRKDIAHYVYVLKCRLSPTEKQNENGDKPAVTYEELSEIAKMEQTLSVDAERADRLISDSLAKDLVRKEDVRIETEGRKKRIINVDTLSENFSEDEQVDVNTLKAKNLVPPDTAYIKVLARGVVDKPLKVYANDFSLSAVKMIALSGGESVKVVTVRKSVKKK